MRKNTFIILLSAIAAYFSTFVARADYSNTVVSLKPVAYWPLNETVQPPPAYIATNSGTLGSEGNGYYSTFFTPATGDGFGEVNEWGATIAGATSDGDGAANFTGNPNCYIQIPHTYPGTVIKAPFSVECWVNPNYASGNDLGDFVNLVTAGGQYQRNFDDNGDWAGFSLGYYFGNWFFSIYNTNGDQISTQDFVDGTGSSGQWNYLVATFDGTNADLYVNGSLADSEVAATNSAGQTYVPDDVNPIVIGRLNPQTYTDTLQGGLDEVAIYTNVLSPSDIATHYSDATAGGYKQAVLADDPLIYLRLDEPAYTPYTDFSSFPTAHNYGSIGNAASGTYQPGTLPGSPGPTGVGFGSANYSVAINGMNAGVDVGGGYLTNVAPGLIVSGTNHPLSVVAWYKGNPADSYNRFQDIVGQGDSGWRFGLGGVGPQFNPGGGGEIGSRDLYNDGRWHMVVGVYDTKTNYIYVDGQLVYDLPYAGVNEGSFDDVVLGGAPDYTEPAGRYLDGSIAQVAFFTNALSLANIDELYNAGEIYPFILSQPTSATVSAGTTFTDNPIFGGSSLVFQWYQNGSPVAGQTNQSLIFNPVGGNNAGNYYVIATNNEGSVTSSVVALNVYTTPTITMEPVQTNLALYIGANANLSVTAGGGMPLSYLWEANGVLVSTNSTYDFTVASSADYICIVTNSYGSVTSSIVSLTAVAQPTNAYPQAVLANNPIAYWRLGEVGVGYPNDGVVAYDYEGGNNGIYTNTTLGQTGYPATPPDPDTAALFGSPAAVDSDMQAPGIDFGTPNGGNAEFSIEAWVYTTYPSYVESDGSGIITKGTGDGGEQFNLDTGSGGGDFRFFVRDASGGVHLCNSTIAADSNWHHLVGVCDEANGELYLYVDGQLAASSSIGVGSGLQSTSNKTLSIGARQSGTTDYDDQFPGVIDEVAIYNYPLTASQILTQYYAVGGFAPTITLEPTNLTVNLGATASFVAAVQGSPVLAYQWYNVTSGTPGTAIPGANSDTLTLDDVTTAENGNQYELVVTNAAGQATSSVVQLTVVAGPPTLLVDIQPLFTKAFTGLPVTLSLTVAGTPPFSYHWLQNGSPVVSTTNTLTVDTLAGTNGYECVITNVYGAVTSSVASVVGVSITDSGTNTSDTDFNFAINFMDAANTVYTVGNSYLNGVFQGLGAYPDDVDNTNWNGFGLPDGYPPTFESYVAPQVASDGTLTPITLSLAYDTDNGAIGAGAGGNTAQGEPSFILGQAAIVNSGNPGIGTSGAPLGGITLSNVPAGIYTLYLYGANFDGTRGATFTFTSGAALGDTNATANPYTDGGSGPLNSFVYGQNYVIFTNVQPSAAGTITGTWGPVSNNGNTGEGDFNGLQLIRVAAPPVSAPFVEIQTIGGKVIVSWTPTAGVLQSATDVKGPYTTITGSTSPYTNSITATQQFFRVSVP